MIPERSVQENILHSRNAPAIQIKVTPSFIYAGGLNFILSNVAQVEQHHFVIADPSRHVVRPLLERIENGDIDPSFVITHQMQFSDAPLGYDIFVNKEDECVKVVLKP